MKGLIVLAFLLVPAVSEAASRYVYNTRVTFDENSCSYAGNSFRILVKLEQAGGRKFIRGGELLFVTRFAKRRELNETYPGLHEVAFQEYGTLHHIEVQNFGRKRMRISHYWGDPQGCQYTFNGTGRLRRGR